ncbi:MAG: SDR family oxidoreductase [Nitrosopumilaceae archaeon]
MKKKNSINNIFNIKGRNVILTGSSGLLGNQFSNILSEAGANVILVDIVNKKNKSLEKTIQKNYKTNPFSIEADISKKDEVVKLKNKIIKKYHNIDVLINNAAFTPRTHPKRSSPLEIYPLDLWENTLATNLTGTFLCCQEFGKIMAKQRKGSIINISSIYGMVGTDPRIYGKSKINAPPSYAATKGGLINLTRYLAAYWHSKNVRVNTLSLGGIFNNQNPNFVRKYSQKTMLNRMAKKDEYNAAILFLASDASSYMTGSNLVIDGGWTAW